jgi:hypothetical protein
MNICDHTERRILCKYNCVKLTWDPNVISILLSSAHDACTATCTDVLSLRATNRRGESTTRFHQGSGFAVTAVAGEADLLKSDGFVERHTSVLLLLIATATDELASARGDSSRNMESIPDSINDMTQIK